MMLNQRRGLSAIRISVVAALAVLLSACSDPADPCDLRGACIVEGADLIVEPPTVTGWPGGVTDTASGLPVVFSGDTVDVEFLVRNRGDELSAETKLVACFDPYSLQYCLYDTDTLSIPTLAPGRAFTTSARIAIDRDPGGEVNVVIFGEIPGDTPAYLNNVGRTRLLIGDARIDGRFDAPESIRAGDSVEIAVRVENISRYGAVPADSLLICMHDYDTGCLPQYPIVFSQPIPALPPGGVYEDTLRFRLPPDAIGPSIEIPRENMWFSACIGRFTWDDDAYTDAYYGCAEANGLTDIIPDLDLMCDAQPIAPDTVLSGATQPALCDLRIGADASVWSFDAEAGDSFTATLIEKERPLVVMEAVDRDGSWRVEKRGTTLSFTVPAAGRYHLAIADAGAFTLSFTRD